MSSNSPSTEDTRTDDELIAEVVSKMRQRNIQFFDAAHTMSCIREVFANRPQPADIIRKVTNAF